MSPRIDGGLADIRTEFPVAPEAEYNMQLKELKLEQTTAAPGKPSKPVFKGFSVITDEGEFKGIHVFHNVVTLTNKGEVNEAALAELKKLAIGIVGEARAIEEDFDTDEMIEGTYRALLEVESYTPEGGKERKKNVIKRVLDRA